MMNIINKLLRITGTTVILIAIATSSTMAFGLVANPASAACPVGQQQLSNGSCVCPSGTRLTTGPSGAVTCVAETNSAQSVTAHLSGLILYPLLMFLIIKLIEGALKSKAMIGQALTGMQKAGQGLVGKADEFAKSSKFYQKRELARQSKKNQRMRAGQEAFAGALTEDAKENASWLERRRSQKWRRRAGGYNELGQQRAFADALSAKHKFEKDDIERAEGMMSVNAARAFAHAGPKGRDGQGRSWQEVISSGIYYTDKDDKGKWKSIGLTQEDKTSLSRLSTAGYLASNDNTVGAAAAVRKLFDTQFVEHDQEGFSHIKNLSAVGGKGYDESATLTREIAAAAGKNGYKNLSYGAVDAGGNYVQYQEVQKTKDPISIVESSVRGMPKEGFEDVSILAGLAYKTRQTGNADADARALIDVVQQTQSVEKEGILRGIADAVGLEYNDLMKLRGAVERKQADEKFVQAQITQQAVPDRKEYIVKRLENVEAHRTKKKEEPLANWKFRRSPGGSGGSTPGPSGPSGGPTTPPTTGPSGPTSPSGSPTGGSPTPSGGGGGAATPGASTAATPVIRPAVPPTSGSGPTGATVTPVSWSTPSTAQPLPPQPDELPTISDMPPPSGPTGTPPTTPGRYDDAT